MIFGGPRPHISSDRSIGSVYLRSHPPFGPFGASRLSVRPGGRCGRVSKCPETVRLRRSETGRVRNPNVSTLVTSRNVWYGCFRVTEPLLVCYRYPWGVTSPLGSLCGRTASVSEVRWLHPSHPRSAVRDPPASASMQASVVMFTWRGSSIQAPTG